MSPFVASLSPFIEHVRRAVRSVPPSDHCSVSVEWVRVQVGDDGRLAGLVAGIEPGAFRSLLELALQHERDGELRQAAATYRAALSSIPRALPPWLRPVLEHAKQVVDANDAELQAYLAHRLADLRARHGNADLGRVDKSMDIL